MTSINAQSWPAFPGPILIFLHPRAILHDESVYGPDVQAFKPERFLNTKIQFPEEVFGFGRRICPGVWMADSTLPGT